MSKRIYRAVEVKDLDLEAMSRKWSGQRVVIGLDIAKHTMVAAVMTSPDEVEVTMKWTHLESSRSWVSWLSSLDHCELVMEPSGTYGDSLRNALMAEGIEVYRVSPKQVHDAYEIYDGVSSSHDGKSAATIAWLHWVGRSTLWQEGSDHERELQAAVKLMSMHSDSFRQVQNRLEAQLSRCWPEVLEILELDSASLLELLACIGGPESIHQNRAEARQLLVSVGGPLLSQEKVDRVLSTAGQTLGQPLLAAEEQGLRLLAEEGRHQRRARRRAQLWVEKLTRCCPVSSRLGAQVGAVTAAVLTADLGSLDRYTSPRRLLKAAGLNLKERSSGRRQGQLAITKRGPSRTRQYLYLAALRWIQKDRIAKAWYEAKVARDGGRRRRRAVIAVSRKLLTGLLWVARGEAFDSRKLFDTNRLGLSV